MRIKIIVETKLKVEKNSFSKKVNANLNQFPQKLLQILPKLSQDKIGNTNNPIITKKIWVGHHSQQQLFKSSCKINLYVNGASLENYVKYVK